MLDVKEERETIIGWPTYSTLDGGILKMEAPLRKAPGGKVSQDREKKDQSQRSCVESLAARQHWSLGVATATGETVTDTYKKMLKPWGVGQKSRGTGTTTLPWAGR